MEQTSTSNHVVVENFSKTKEGTVQITNHDTSPSLQPAILLPDRSRHRQRVRMAQRAAAASVSFARARAVRGQ
jgi:hypothetical protein